MGDIPIAPLFRIVKTTTNMRVSQDANEMLRDVLEEKAIKISEVAGKYADSAGRQTIKADDIIKAVETLDKY